MTQGQTVVQGVQIGAQNVDKAVEVGKQLGDKYYDGNNNHDPGKDPNKYTKNNFRKNLEKQFGKAPDTMKKPEAHHVLPQKFESLFKDLGVNIHNPQYGSWVEKASHGSWSKQYNAAWDTFFKMNENPTAQQALNYATELSKEYGFAINF